MNHKTMTAAAAIAATALLSGCGASGSGKPSPAASRPTRLYTLQMTGTAVKPAGPAGAVGVGIIAFHGPSTVCWRFAHLHGFVDATSASILSGSAGHNGALSTALSAGPKLHHRGCAPIAQALSRQIWADPSAYYVTVSSAADPHGALRAQL